MPDRRTVALAATVLLSLYVLFAPDVGGAPRFVHADKAVHAGLFALLGLTAWWRLGGRPGVWAAVAAYAGASEVVQAVALSHRGGDPLDLLADLLGLAAAALLVSRRRGPVAR